jgi:hypothetical protein
MEPDDKKTPVPAPESRTNMKPKWQDLEQQMADEEAYGFVVPAGETDD